MPDLPTDKDNKAVDTAFSYPFLKRFSKKTLILIAGFLILIVMVILGVLLSKDSSDQAKQAQIDEQNAKLENIKKQTNLPSSKESTSTIVYGAWTGQQSVIKSVDLLSGKSVSIAALPINIKKVSILSPKQFVYIDQTNAQDHGKQIVRFGIKEKTSEVIIVSDEGYGIDDYVISPNKRYMAVWEIALAPSSQILFGGRSRVYAVDLLNPTSKHLIYNELATSPIHYPRAILNNGRLFTDKFLPNDPNGGAGWSYGMGVSDFEGKDKKDLSQMENGTYGTQPSISSNGKFLVFAGYDGTLGDGKAAKDGYRQAILKPNTVELLDTDTLERTKLPNLPNTSTYISADWDNITGNILLTIIPTDPEKTGLYFYDLTSHNTKQINIPGNDQATYSYVSTLSNGKFLIGKADESASSLGNLGDGYAPSLSQLFSFDPSANTAGEIPIDNIFVQYITTLPQNYFANVLGFTAYAAATTPIPQPTFIDLYSDKNATKQNLQLYTFLFKQDLTQTRETQQSTPVATPTPTSAPTIPPRGDAPTREPFKFPETINCWDLAQAQCHTTKRNTCVKNARIKLKEQGKCNQSPLYLYGQAGQQVKVVIQTPVQNAIPSYGNGYDVTIQDAGKMEIKGQIYNAITYDYKSNLRRVAAPRTGTISKLSEVSKVLQEYAKKLGLNEKETADLVNSAKQKLASPYILISFYDQATSEQILPLSFYPEPDNYLNVVFYFKELDEKPNYTPIPPVFPALLNRTGLTAVEVSEIVE